MQVKFRRSVVEAVPTRSPLKLSNDTELPHIPFVVIVVAAVALMVALSILLVAAAASVVAVAAVVGST